MIIKGIIFLTDTDTIRLVNKSACELLSFYQFFYSFTKIFFFFYDNSVMEETLSIFFLMTRLSRVAIPFFQIPLFITSDL